MANEKRLIDANALMDRFCELANRVSAQDNWFHLDVITDEIMDAPTVDAVVLPCKIGDDVYIIPSKVNFKLNVLSGLEKNNRVYHQKVAEIVFEQDCWYVLGNADKEYGTGRVLIDRFYKENWFLTQEEAEAALAKMDGGNEDVNV